MASPKLNTSYKNYTHLQLFGCQCSGFCCLTVSNTVASPCSSFFCFSMLPLRKNFPSTQGNFFTILSACVCYSKVSQAFLKVCQEAPITLPLKGIFAWYRFLGWRLFSWDTLTVPLWFLFALQSWFSVFITAPLRGKHLPHLAGWDRISLCYPGLLNFVQVCPTMPGLLP